MTNTSTLHDEARPEMDDLLHDYFQAELPQPWPNFKSPKDVQAKTGSFWARYSGRAILAGSVALLVAAYLMLGGFFPTTQGPSPLNQAIPNIGLKEKGPPPHQHDDELPKSIGNVPNRK